MRRVKCQAPVLDAEKRAKLCGEPATTDRDVPTGYGDETATLAFCDLHAAEMDTKAAKHATAPACRARWNLLRYMDIALPNGARGEHSAAIRGIVDDIIDAAVLAVREDDPAGRGGKGGAR